MDNKAARLVDVRIVIGKLQNTHRVWKCSDTFVHFGGMWSRWWEGKWDSNPGAKEEVAKDQA